MQFSDTVTIQPIQPANGSDVTLNCTIIRTLLSMMAMVDLPTMTWACRVHMASAVTELPPATHLMTSLLLHLMDIIQFCQSPRYSMLHLLIITMSCNVSHHQASSHLSAFQ